MRAAAVIRRSVVTLGAAALVPLAACGVVRYEAAPDEGSANRTSTTSEAGPDDTPEVQEVAAQPGRAGVMAVPIDDVEATMQDGRLVARPVWTAVDSCHGLERVEVARSGEVVTLVVWEGLDAGIEPESPACMRAAPQRTTTVDVGTLPPGTYTLTAGSGGEEGEDTSAVAVVVEVS